MNSIRPRPRISRQDMQQILAEVEKYTDRSIDGKILCCLLTLAYCCALTTEELRSLRVKHILDRDGNLSGEIRTANSVIQVPAQLEDALRNHLTYLKKSPAYRFSKNAPLFPVRRRTGDNAEGFYTERNLSKHLVRVGRRCRRSVRPLDVRQSGICEHFEEQKSEGRSDEEALRNTASFARRSPVHTRKLLGGALRSYPHRFRIEDPDETESGD